jgi:four helix bundle protein
MVKGANIADRLLELATTILELARNQPKDITGRHVASQIVRSGTSAGANYEEARAAESRADFIHKVSLATKEIRETIFWLRLIQRSSNVNVDDAVREACELAAILVASARTARARQEP